MNAALETITTAFRNGDLREALRLANRELSAGSASAQLHHIAGLIHCRQGELQRGVRLLRRACDSEPHNIAYRVMLVRALADSGQAEEALAAAPRPAGLSAPELALWHARAEAADLTGQHELSAEAWQRLSFARPADWRAWNNLGEALARLERWSEAIPALKRAVEANPQDARLRRNLATALARAGNYDESASKFEKLVEHDPADAGVRLILARLYADLGRSPESIAQLDRAAELKSASAGSDGRNNGYIAIALGSWLGQDRGNGVAQEQVEAVLELALLFERTNRMDALRKLLEEAEGIGIGREQLAYPAAALELRDGHPETARDLLLAQPRASDPVRWHRLMSKVMDALGDAHDSFQQAASMNRAVHDFAHWRERGASYRAHIRKLAAMVTPGLAEQLPSLSPGERPSPVFLVGFPRSGTTLLDTFLMGHPGTIVLEEKHMLGAAELVLGSVADLPRKTTADLHRARTAYFDELDRHADATSPGLIVDKLPLNMLGLPIIASLFPDARIIFAQRHPCDCVLSGFMQSFVMNDAMACFLTIDDAADLYDVAMDLFTRSRDAVAMNVHTLVYEDLVVDPGRALRPLVGFLGLAWDEQMLDHRKTARSRGAIITPSYDQVVQPLNDQPSGRWRRYERDLEPVLPRLLRWADRLGYKR